MVYGSTGQQRVVALDGVTVTFRDATPELLDWYVSTGEWEGRAGAYAVQGRGAAPPDEVRPRPPAPGTVAGASDGHAPADREGPRGRALPSGAYTRGRTWDRASLPAP